LCGVSSVLYLSNGIFLEKMSNSSDMASLCFRLFSMGKLEDIYFPRAAKEPACKSGYSGSNIAPDASSLILVF
jgi:hypothetical protein